MHCQTGVSQILSDTLMVNHLGQDKGLVQLNANALTQDENGFLWVGTEAGSGIFWKMDLPRVYRTTRITVGRA